MGNSVLGVLIGVLLGYLVRIAIAKKKIQSVENKAAKIRQQAKEEAEKIILQARKKSVDILEEVKKEEKLRQQQLIRQEERLDRREQQLEQLSQAISQKERKLLVKAEKVKELKQEIETLKEKEIEKLEKISKTTKEKAYQELQDRIEKQYSQDLYERLKKLELEGEKKLQERAKNIMSLAMQRLAQSYTSDMASYTLSLPSDEIKGRIIGKEGRNIRAFERETGVEVLIDETPEVITLSSFNPIRREIARVAMEKLIADGRIQPALIEKTVADARQKVAAEIVNAGEEAVYKLGIVGLHPDLIKILGRLKFRTSYGQNVLEHSIEVARIAEIIATELGANAQVAKKAGLLHDVGKAVDHEVQGTHVEIGRRILKKYGIEEEVIKAMEAHHGEYKAQTVEAVIIQVADAISGSRPGARRSSLEEFLQRLEDLENIAKSYEGVEKCYAIQAGREIRIFVQPDKVADLEAKKMAREIAKEIEEKLRYPGEIRVTVIRENRVVEYAR